MEEKQSEKTCMESIVELITKLFCPDASHIQGMSVMSPGYELDHPTRGVYGSLGRSKKVTMTPQKVSNECEFSEKYVLSEMIGCGSSSKCYRCVRRQDGRQFLVKVVNFASLSLEYPKRVLRQLTREVSSLKCLDHPNIVHMEEYFFSGDQLFIVEEFLRGGELYGKILDHQGIREPQAKQIFYQIASAVHYMHRHKIIHRDIKPENILFVNQRSLDIKLIDFGFSKYMKYGSSSSFLGSGGYLSPELRLSGAGGQPRYNEAVDIWALGCVLYVMISACMPFEDSVYERPASAFELKFFPPKKWIQVSPQLKDLLRHMLNPDADVRYTSEDVMKHPWVVSGQDDNLDHSMSLSSTKDSEDASSDSVSGSDSSLIDSME